MLFSCLQLTPRSSKKVCVSSFFLLRVLLGKCDKCPQNAMFILKSLLKSVYSNCYLKYQTPHFSENGIKKPKGRALFCGRKSFFNLNAQMKRAQGISLAQRSLCYSSKMSGYMLMGGNAMMHRYCLLRYTPF